MIAALVVVGMAARWPFWAERGETDMLYFGLWAGQMVHGRPANAYLPDPSLGRETSSSNYPPGSLWILAASALAYERLTGQELTPDRLMRMGEAPHTPAARMYFRVAKSPAILADLATGAILYWVLRKRVGTAWAAGVALAFVLQPGVLYNSARWGQVDAINTLFMVLSLEMAARRRYALLGVLMTAAILTKLQAIVIAPAVGLCLLLGPDGGTAAAAPGGLRSTLRSVFTAARLKRLGGTAVASAALAAVVCLPFIVGGAGRLMWGAYAHAVGSYAVATVNAFNLWGVVFPLPDPTQASWVPDTTTVLGYPAHSIGFALLLTAVGAVVVRLTRGPDAPEVLRWAAVALCIAFFSLPTQIHERYLHPAIAITAWAFVRRSWWWGLWLALGCVYAANMLWVMPYHTTWTGHEWIRALTYARLQGLYPSQVWGALITLLTVAVLVTSPRVWRRPGEGQP